jgi:hypothetical protein
MGKQNRTVYQRQDGVWVNQRNDAQRASSVCKTQGEAVKDARRMMEGQGGELTVMGLNGRIRSKDTIPPAPDPCPPKDKEH